MARTPTTVILIGTCDTKLDELLYLRDVIESHSAVVTLIDVGRSEVEHDAVTIRRSRLLQDYGNAQDVDDLPRADIIKLMADCATQAVEKLYKDGLIHGIVAAGGSGGTSLTAHVMRKLPVGFPKLLVSTVASGDTGPIVGETDITMMYSVVDIAGMNQVLRNIFDNAGAAIAGMAKSYASKRPSQTMPKNTKKRVGITMFGVTTPAVDTIRKHLESTYPIECYVFHATGHGGKAMERLVRDGALDAVLDLTTTEICDYLTGGNMSAGPHRLQAALEMGIPDVISLGANDMANFGPRSTVPPQYRDRLLYEHNPVVTLMRSSKEECRQIGDFIVGKIKEHARNPHMIEVWIPTGGISMIAVPGGPFEDSDADNELFHAIKTGLKGTGIQIVEDARAVNDPGFAIAIAEALARKMSFQLQ